MRAPKDLLDPRHYQAVLRPPLEAETLPAWCYTSPAWYAREVERLFLRSWTLIGRTDRVPEPGDYVAVDYAGAAIVAVRGRDGQVRAFANACRHRGARLLDGEGNCKLAIKCPYHSWIYGLDGALQGCDGMEDTRDFDRARYGLRPVRLETWGGFMFVNCSDAAPPLKTWLGEIHDMILPYAPEDLVCTRRKSFDLACNWKLYVENFNDLGHIPTVHKASLGKLREKYDSPCTFTHYECAQGFTAWTPHAGTRTLLDGIDGPKGFDPIPGLPEANRKGSLYPTIFPHACFGFCIDSAWSLEIYPQGPERMRLVVSSLFHKDAVARPDFEDVAQRYYARMDVAVPEDNAINELTQRGLAARDTTPGRIGKEETAVNALNRWWVRRTLGLDEGGSAHGRAA
ncbi:MAG: aromatic ring-hydroxylating dioxygenase subunit alpha [Alphaproteobacteria bacterium]|nr:aromatic ring-hydroxylating dioxygenase subunit alpha [Alphaproteobacteria bacterium]